MTVEPAQVTLSTILPGDTFVVGGGDPQMVLPAQPTLTVPAGNVPMVNLKTGLVNTSTAGTNLVTKVGYRAVIAE